MIKRTLMGLAGAVLVADAAVAAEPESCKTVRFSDVGWTDITATTALASVVLEGLGYKPRTDILSVPVTYQSLKNGDIDVFLGNWMPTMEADIAPFKADGSVETVRANLEGAKYTLAVPKYLADAGAQGLRRHRQVQGPARRQDLRHRARQRRQPPDPEDDRRGHVRARRLRAGRELRAGHAGRGAAGRRAATRPIVFLGWEPHPMNTNFELTYLTGGDDVFGPNFGGATVFTNVRKGYPAGVPERRQAAAEPGLHAADGERGDGRHPRRRQGARGRRRRRG